MCNNRLFMFCGILLCLDALILFLWQVLDLMESKRVTVLVKVCTVLIHTLLLPQGTAWTKYDIDIKAGFNYDVIVEVMKP
jgi:hypothetical protein